MKTLLTTILCLFALVANAGSPYLVDRETGKFLGNLNNNRYDPNSVANPVGKYGSRYSPDSINNPYGKWGSRYSPDSANNPYSTGGPLIIHRDH